MKTSSRLRTVSAGERISVLATADTVERIRRIATLRGASVISIELVSSLHLPESQTAILRILLEKQ